VTQMFPTCPRCGGYIPNDVRPGEYPGALSRTDNATEVCSECGTREAMEELHGALLPQELWHASQQFAGGL
jgi:hypothetical protein